MNKLAKLASIVILILILLLIGKMAGAQTVAVVAPVATNTLGEMVSQAIFAVVSAFLLFVTGFARNLINQYAKKAMHERGTAVVKDALYSALDDAGYTLAQVQSDKAIKDAIKLAWLKIAVARLDDLSGFKKTDLSAWVAEQQGIILGKLAV